jgi:hypothetical protein
MMGSVKTVCIVLCVVFGLLAVYAAHSGSYWGVVLLSFVGFEALGMAIIARNLERQKD